MRKVGQDPKDKNIRPYLALGFDYTGELGDEVYGNCPFCERDKFYVNRVTGQFDCKSLKHCGVSGNVTSFIRQYAKFLSKNTKDSEYKYLSDQRGIPRRELQSSGLGVIPHTYMKEWLIPCKNLSGEIIGGRLYRQSLSSVPIAGTEALLFGLENFNPSSIDTVYLCESEWDCMAFRANTQFDDNECCISTPGAGILKEEWFHFFDNKHIIFCFDSDSAGQKSLLKHANNLSNYSNNITYSYIKWPEDSDDIREFFNKGGLLKTLLSFISELNSSEKEVTHTPTHTFTLKSKERPSFNEVIKEFSKFLKITPEISTGIRVAYATVISNLLPGDPVWLYLVSPAGTSKTEILRTFSNLSHCIFRSTLSANSLISGFRGPEGKDPSLIPQLNGKTLVFKDMTVILSKQPKERDEIFGLFRDAYDGEISRHLGNFGVKEFKSKFSILAGVTPKIHGEKQAASGERFLMYQMMQSNGQDNSDIIEAAINSVGQETNMRESLSNIAQRFLEVKIAAEEVPPIPPVFLKKIVSLAQVTSILRGVVERDPRHERLLYRPEYELGTRVGKQLTKLGQALALTYPNYEFNDEAYNILKKTAFDSCTGFNMDVIRLLFQENKLSAKQISTQANIPQDTLKEYTDGLLIFGAVTKNEGTDPDNGHRTQVYSLSEKMRLNLTNINLNLNGVTTDHARTATYRIAKKSNYKIAYR